MANYEQIVRVGTTDQGGGSGYIPGMAAASGGGFSQAQMAFMAIAAGTTGAALDTTVVTLAGKMRILGMRFITTTAIDSAGDTVTLRTGASAGGAAVFVCTCSATGSVWNVGASATSTIAAGTILYARRNEGGVAGQLMVLAQAEI